MEKSVTIVSALYYIGRDRWKYSAFPPGVDRYKSWVVNLLSLDAKIYFFVDDYYYDYIVETRKQYDPEFKNTIIKKIPLTDLYFYKKYYVPEACLMFSPEFRDRVFFQDSADMNYPMYHIINFSKIEFVKIASEENPFNSTHFFWYDAGGMRDGLQKYSKVSWPVISEDFFNDKVIHFSHREQFTIYPNKDEYFRSQNRNIQGTAWIVPIEKVNTFFEMIDNQVDTIIKEQIVGSDEKVYDFLYDENKDFYQLKQCGWFEYYNLCKKQEKNIFLDFGRHEQQGLDHFIRSLSIDKTWDIYTYEPNPLVTTENRLKHHGDLNIFWKNEAVWIENTTVTFGLYGNEGTSQGSLIEETGGSKFYRDSHSSIDVPAVDICDILAQFTEDQNIYIKMDIEWSEYPILEKLMRVGFPKNIKHLWVEFHGQDQQEFIDKKNTILNHIRNLNINIEEWY
jgi:FkbM family methyltransferase